MINYDQLYGTEGQLRNRFLEASPFPHLVVDDFLMHDQFRGLLEHLPDAEKIGMRKSRDYIFAKNKFEKSGLRELGQPFADLYEDLVSERFSEWLGRVTGESVFVDPEFHGGGLHQGGPGSFLDMHADFDFHPLHQTWFRNLNILLYLNECWRPEFGGELKLRDARDGRSTTVAPIANRCVIMHTRSYTLHGYDRIRFPAGSYRRSVAAYAYSLVDVPPRHVRSTTWYPEHGGRIKSWLGRHWPALVRLKTKWLGSATAKNR
jgi:hypothetical protein